MRTRPFKLMFSRPLSSRPATAAGAGRAEALAREVLGRGPAAVGGDPVADEVGDGARVLVEPPERLALVLAERPRETGADRVDEHEIGEVEDGLRVVENRIGRRAIVDGVARHDHPARPERSHVKPDGGRAGSAIPDEGHRPRRGIVNAVLDVGEREDAACRLAVVVRQVGLAGRRGVAHRAAPKTAEWELVKARASGISGGVSSVSEATAGPRANDGDDGSEERR